MNLQEEFWKLVDKIKQYCDEVCVQMYLVQEDVKDEWDDFEQDWQCFCNCLDELLYDVEDVFQEVC